VKIEQLIVQHLYNSRQVTLQGIGTFRLDPSVILPAANEKEKDFVIPDNAFKFEYNLRAEEDEALIQYIVQHTRKILPLASADLDSYVTLAKQFLNIGKPLVIEGIGTIQKNQLGEYQFLPGHFVLPKIDDIPRQLKEKQEEAISFETKSSESHSRRNLMIFITLFVIAATGAGIYYMATHESIEVTPTAADREEIKKPVLVPDTTNLKTDTTLALAPAPVQPPPADTFNIVLRSYKNSIAAEAALKKFSSYGHKMIIIKADSLNYQLAMPFASPLSDTARAKDSLQRFFGGKPFVKL